MARGPYAHGARPARSASSWACRAWANPASIRRRSHTRACPRTSSPAAPTTWARSRTCVGTPAGERLLKPHRGTPTAWGKQMVPKTLIEDGHQGTDKVDFWGTGGHEEPTSDQYKKYTYPIPKEEGGTEFHMMWTDTPCRHDLLELRQRRRRRVSATRRSSASWPSTPGSRTTVSSRTSSCPSAPPSKCDDISPCIREGDSFQSVILMRQAIEPVGESKSDYEAVVRNRQEAGHGRGGHRGLHASRTSSKGTYTGMRFDADHAVGGVPGEGLLRLPVSKDWEKWPAGLYEFYKDPEGQPAAHAHRQARVLFRELGRRRSPTTKSARRIPKWIEKGITHDERISSKRALAYPLAGHVQPRPLAGPRPGGRYPLEQGGHDRQGQGLRRLPVRALLDQPEGCRSTGHQERRHRPGLQRARRRALRRLGLGARHAGRGLHRPRRPHRLHQSRPNWTAAARSTPSRRRV